MSDIKSFVEFSKPFVDAAKNIFSTMISSNLNTKAPTLKTTALSKGDISAVIGMTGTHHKDGKDLEFKGMLVISFPFETYVKVANAMLGENHTEFNPQIADVGAEISNIIMGNAKRDLVPYGYKIGMAVPSTVSGKDHSLRYLPGTTVIIIPMESLHGEFFMEICFQEK